MGSINILLDKFQNLPSWAKWLIVILAISSLDAIHIAWGERRFIAGFAESLIAVLLYWTIVLGSFAVGIYAGSKAAEYTAKKWLGWIVGIVAFIAVSFIGTLTHKIPGVGWRIERMLDAPSYDY